MEDFRTLPSFGSGHFECREPHADSDSQYPQDAGRSDGFSVVVLDSSNHADLRTHVTRLQPRAQCTGWVDSFPTDVAKNP